MAKTLDDFLDDEEVQKNPTVVSGLNSNIVAHNQTELNPRVSLQL